MRRVLTLFVLALPLAASAAASFVAGSTVTCQNALNQGTMSCSAPANIQNNDIIVMACGSRDNAAHTCSGTDCTGYTKKIDALGSTAARLSIWWKRTDGSETALTMGHTSGTESFACGIGAYRGINTGADPWDSGSQAGVETEAAASALSNAGFNLANANSMVIGAFTASDNNTTHTWSGTIGTPSEAAWLANGNGTDNMIAQGYFLRAATGATGTFIFTQGASDAGTSWTGALVPAAVTGATSDLTTLTSLTTQGTVSATGAAASTLASQLSHTTQGAVSTTGASASTLASLSSVTTQGALDVQTGPVGATSDLVALNSASTLGAVSSSGAAAAILASLPGSTVLGSLSAVGHAAASLAPLASVSISGTASATGASVADLGSLLGVAALWPVMVVEGAASTLASLSSVARVGRAFWGTPDQLQAIIESGSGAPCPEGGTLRGGGTLRRGNP